MGRSPCCAKEGLNRGSWTAVEDKILAEYIQVHGEGKWKQLPKNAGLKRCGKSCRLRWLNYLRPDIKRGNIGEDEEDLIVRLHKLLGNRWSLIAGRIPGRTDNEIKNYWNTNLSKKASSSTKLSPATTTKNLNKSSQFIKPENTSTSKNAMPMTSGSNSTTQVFRTRATKCLKVVIQPPPPLPPPPPPPQQASTSTNNIIHSHDQGEAVGVDSLFNDLPMIPDDIDDLSLGDFCLDDFLNNDEFDENQSSSIMNNDNEKDCALETVHRTSDRNEFRSFMMSGQGCTNVGSGVNYEHDQLCPMFIDSYDNNWDL